MIDVHCHIDLYENPLELIKECENAGMTVIGMTNLPTHFEMGCPHVRPFKRTRLALGMHPLYAEHHDKEFDKFKLNIDNTSYIGEVGLDFSREGIGTKDIQIKSLKRILTELVGKKKILSLHSRRAEKEVLNELIDFGIKSAIFHWYSGSLSLIDEIIKAGYYFSINPAMIKSQNGQKIISKIPQSRILTESDGPFIVENGNILKPKEINRVLAYLSTIWNLPLKSVEEIIDSNFHSLIKSIK